MPVRFQKYLKTTRFLDPNREYQEGSRTTEIRLDPLTGRTCRILNFPMRVPQKPDLSPLVNISIEMGCPFCPEAVGKATPKFPPELVPEGRVSVGEALVFPNMFPYDTFSAVGIFSGEHFVPLLGFSQAIVSNAFQAGIDFLRLVQQVQGPYGTINWNYMPLAGGSIIHPHIHIIAGDVPSNYQRETVAACRAYRQENGSVFWDDLLEAEQQAGERYIGSTGSVHWLASFAPLGFMDIMAVFPFRQTVPELTSQDLRDFTQGLLKVFAYLDSKGFWSFNLALHTGLAGDTSYRVHARIVPRFAFSPVNTSDVRYAEILHHEVMTTTRPESLCRELKETME
ncbi:MAG: hypothetical protein Q8R28_02870 [Dehalococcoidia bacterium]|nr:hypothetical protein [Dehalococcoidia bacterium]